jgi:DHA2 family multidrug resistance protein
MLYHRLTEFQRWLIVAAVMAATIMEVLDTTIVNVALPYMKGALGANSDQIAWTVTTYLVASGIVMPLTGYLTDVIGRKRFLMVCITGFTVSSALCGLATSLPQMVSFRALQGALGGSLVPMSQAILIDIFPRDKRGSAMALWGVGVMLGPILGPTLGGYLTEVFNWRWTFYVNLPVGIVASIMALLSVPETEIKKRPLDWFGLIAIVTGVGALQYLLDRGNSQGWFSATDIKIAAVLSSAGFVSFVVYQLLARPRHSIFSLNIFADKNFTVSSALITAMGLGLFGIIVIQPLLLESLLGYPVFKAGLIMAPRGISAMISMVLVGQLIRHVDVKILITAGIILNVSGEYLMTYYSFITNDAWQIWPGVIQGLGMGFIFIPLSSTAFATLPTKYYTEAAGLFSLLRTIGSSIGVSITMTFYTRHAQMAWNDIVGHINPFRHALTHYLSPLSLQPDNVKAGAILSQTVNGQAQMIAMLDTFAFIGWCFAMMLPLVWLLKSTEASDMGELH